MDDHLLPFDGTIDWETTMRLIADSPYELPLNFETPHDRYSLREFPYYERAFAVAQRLDDMVRSARQARG